MKYLFNKADKALIFFCCAVFLFFLPPQINAQISQETAALFRNAKIQVLNQPMTPQEFTLSLLSGGNASLSDYKGKVVILNFWATWCPPCRAEMPSMETLYQRFNSQGLEILAVDIGENANTVRQFIQNNKYTFPVMLDSNSRISRIYGIEAIPTSYILDREGKIAARVVGSISWDTPQVFAAFQAFLAGR